MEEEEEPSFDDSLSRWQTLSGIGKAQGTRDFHAEVVSSIRKAVPDLTRPARAVTEDEVLAIAQHLAHYCPSRWNTAIAALKFITPEARHLKRRPLRFRHFTPPNQVQFELLLRECDRLPRSRAGLVVRLLSLTGLRISEARKLDWSHVFEDRIEVPGRNAKNGERRSIPLVPGAAEVLARLRAVGSGPHVLPRPSVRRGLEKACERAGLPKLSYHCFRHLFATRCIESGVDLPTVARWLGHQDGGGLLSRMYFHLLDNHSRAMAARVRIMPG